MSEVVLRCPACGTTQSQPGECEACSEGEVRYFCSNHSPGLWLDEGICKKCGIKFGDPPRRHPRPTPHAAPRPPARDTRRSVPRPPLAADAEAPRRVPRRAPTAADPEDTSDPPSLAELLVRTWERERSRHEIEEEVWRGPTVEAPRPVLPIAGCLVRLVLFVLVLIALGLGGLFLLMSGLSIG